MVRARLLRLLERGGGGRVLLLPPPPGMLAADLVDQAPGGDGKQPALRAAGHPTGGPGGHRLQHRLLHRVLAGAEPAVAAHQRAEHLGRKLAQQLPDVLRVRRAGHWSAADSCKTGHSSTGSPSANGMSAAICSARSWLAQSSSQKLARYSLVSR